MAQPTPNPNRCRRRILATAAPGPRPDPAPSRLLAEPRQDPNVVPSTTPPPFRTRAKPAGCLPTETCPPGSPGSRSSANRAAVRVGRRARVRNDGDDARPSRRTGDMPRDTVQTLRNVERALIRVARRCRRGARAVRHRQSRGRSRASDASYRTISTETSGGGQRLIDPEMLSRSKGRDRREAYDRRGKAAPDGTRLRRGPLYRLGYRPHTPRPGTLYSQTLPAAVWAKSASQQSPREPFRCTSGSCAPGARRRARRRRSWISGGLGESDATPWTVSS